MKIEVGQIFIVKTDTFITSGRSNKFNRGFQLKKNELIEIRYPYAWHFRTIDSHYWHAEPEELLKHCELFGTIWGNVRFKNKSSLSEIINQSLYDHEKENSYNWAKNFTIEQLKAWKLDKLLRHAKDEKEYRE